MRSITKGTECKELRSWKRLNATSPQNIHYNNLSGPIKDAMISKLAKEQGGLCAYTMKQLASQNGKLLAHIEHILPRSLHPGQSVVWGNLVACVPQPNVSCDFGAKLKDDYDPATKPFVNPTLGGAGVQFRFRESGEVEGLTPAAAATADEKVLNLNHADLIHDRVGKIRGALDQKPTATQARHRAQELRKFDKHGALEPYCEAVAQVLEAYALRLEKRATRVAGAKRT